MTKIFDPEVFMHRLWLSLLLSLCLITTYQEEVLAAEHGASSEESAEGDETSVKKAPEIGYYTMDPDFVTNLASANPKEKLHYVRIKISLMLFDEKDKDVIVGLNPVLRDTILSVISAKDFTQVASNEGREKLRQECRERLTSVLQNKIGQDLIRDVLFLNYMFQ